MTTEADFQDLVDLMARLRSPGGCPWDREQTPMSIRKNILEEACEVIDAIDDGNQDNLCEELGDLLLQVVFQAQMAAEAGHFTINEVIAAIIVKLRRRHPHIFADKKLNNAEEVVRQWEEIKHQEKDGYGALSEVPRSLPALARAQKMQHKAAKAGFDWRQTADIVDKLVEEAAEFAATPVSDAGLRELEFGDILFTLVNLGRRLGVNSELALRRANDKFQRRYQAMLDKASKRGFDFARLSAAAKDKLWNEVKSNS